MSKHTPGPWKSVRGCSTIVTEDINGWEIADLRTDVPNFTANATLIAAAPDFLAALEAVVRVADRATDEFDLARAAIARAKGESL